ncbi:cupin domain-containing protein [Hyphococcus flavus]|uniref:Cupin domain-containing protein n=1 Tax=Hyphococcus flavus TaxID=1866326 RepID=A0AAF0CEF2_9PROT|nr:cupin domain-containing protein [Hyphococcus flavus]WDI30074.1 cupin domain-containing protein [Hyphococcus flavus]
MFSKTLNRLEKLLIFCALLEKVFSILNTWRACAMNSKNDRPQEEDIGARLMRVRKAFGLSQRQLSKKAGIANATISQIESGALNPTVGTLRKIVSGLPMSLSTFFDDDTLSMDDKFFYAKGELTELSEGAVSYRQVGGPIGKAIQFMWERYAPGGNTGRHNLTHEGEECGFVISGELTVTVAGHTRTLRAGEAYYFKSDLPHSFKNDGVVSCELITACTPPTF